MSDQIHTLPRTILSFPDDGKSYEIKQFQTGFGWMLRVFEDGEMLGGTAVFCGAAANDDAVADARFFHSVDLREEMAKVLQWDIVNSNRRK